MPRIAAPYRRRKATPSTIVVLKENEVRRFAECFLISLLLAPWGGVLADPAADVCAALRTTRIHLIALMGATDKLTLSNNETRLHAASDKLDAFLAAMLQGRNSQDAAKAAEFQPVWTAFKKTRESEIIPAVEAAKIEVARTIALGVQAERMRAMRTIMDCKR